MCLVQLSERGGECEFFVSRAGGPTPLDSQEITHGSDQMRNGEHHVLSCHIEER